MRFTSSNFGMEPSRTYTNNLRRIKLAIDLQMCSRRNNNRRCGPSVRVTKKALESSYYYEEFASSQEASRKMCQRDLKYMESTFSLSGSESSGYYMGQEFPKFKHMFEHWLNKLEPMPKTDARLHIMLEGLIRSIENGMRADPIVIPEIASALKEKYGKKNIRDTKQPLQELFCNNTIATHLKLIELEEDLESDLDGDGAAPERLIIDRNADPILLRLRSRDEVGDNEDISINLALPGRVRSILEKHSSNLSDTESNKLFSVANAVCESHCWIDQFGEQVVPYLLYREGHEGEFFVTLWNWDTGEYTDKGIHEIHSVPETTEFYFVPYGVSGKLWDSFKSLSK